jgi:hypothetical protein
MAHDEFISYSDIDRAAADGTSRHPLLDRARDSTPGADWGAAIINAIDHCCCYRSDLSASANRSRQIRREVERGDQAAHPSRLRWLWQRARGCRYRRRGAPVNSYRFLTLTDSLRLSRQQLISGTDGTSKTRLRFQTECTKREPAAGRHRRRPAI